MTLLTYCLPCKYGAHDKHEEIIQAVPEGMLGGARCKCEGECRDFAPPAELRLPDVEALPQPLAASLAARAQTDGRSMQAELRLAVEHWLAWSHDQGEMRHPGDVATGFGDYGVVP